MITGRFGDTSGRPFIEARLYLPRLNLSGDVSFLLDTGADASILMPADARRLGVPFNQLEGDNECGGLGGTVHCFVERALSKLQVVVRSADMTFDLKPAIP